MLPGDLDPSLIRQWTTVIRVNGEVQIARAWSIDGELAGDLPAAVESGAGVTHRAGQISWMRPITVTNRPVHPFRPASGWIPAKGDRVEIYVTDGFTTFPQFTGRIDVTRGSVADGDCESTIIDDVDDLSAPFSHPCITRRMPPRVFGGPQFMYVESSPMHLIVAAAREAGYRNYPATTGTTLLDAPLQGSTWPLVGKVTASTHRAELNDYPLVRTDGPDGWAMHDFSATYTPAASASTTHTLRLRMSAGPLHAAGAGMQAHYGADMVQLWVNSSRVAQLSVNGTIVVQHPLGSGVRASAYMAGSTYGIWTEDSGSWVTATGPDLPDAAMTSLRLIAEPSAQVWGMTAERSGNLSTAVFTPNLRLDVSGYLVTTGVVCRAIEGSTVAEVLEDIGGSLLLASYFDAQGRLTIRSSDRIVGAAPVQTITTKEDVFELHWQDDLLSVRSKVIVVGDRQAHSLSRFHNVQYYQGNSDTMENGDSREEFIKVPADEEWVLYPDNPPQPAWYSTSFNSGQGSFIGGSITTEDIQNSWATNVLTMSFEQVSERTWLVTHSVQGLDPGWVCELRTADFTGTSLKKQYQLIGLPLIRGACKIEFMRAQTPAKTAAAKGRTLTHDVKHWAGWASHTTMQERIRDFIADRVTNPEPEIVDLQVEFDPRREIGDVIDLESMDYMGVRIRCLLTGVGSTADERYDQALKCRIISVTLNGNMTHGEFNALAPVPLSHAQFNAEGNQTHAQFNAAA